MDLPRIAPASGQEHGYGAGVPRNPVMVIILIGARSKKY